MFLREMQEAKKKRKHCITGCCSNAQAVRGVVKKKEGVRQVRLYMSGRGKWSSVGGGKKKTWGPKEKRGEVRISGTT